MRNVTPTRITNEYLNFQYKNNNARIPSVPEPHHLSLQLEEHRIIVDEEKSTAVTYFENNDLNPNFQPDEVTEHEIIKPPPAKKKRSKDPEDKLKVSKCQWALLVKINA